MDWVWRRFRERNNVECLEILQYLCNGIFRWLLLLHLLQGRTRTGI